MHIQLPLCDVNHTKWKSVIDLNSLLYKHLQLSIFLFDFYWVCGKMYVVLFFIADLLVFKFFPLKVTLLYVWKTVIIIIIGFFIRSDK